MNFAVRPLKRRHVTASLLERVGNIAVSRMEMKDGDLVDVEGKVNDYGSAILEALVNNKELYRFMFDIAGVYSLSEIASSPLLWSHYADGHAGMAICYLVNEIPTDLGERDLRLRKIRYRKRYPKLEQRTILTNISAAWETMVTNKGLAWAYEKEWRLLGQFGGELVKCPFPIDYIAFGLKASVENKARVLKVCAALNIKCYQAIRHPRKYFPIYLPIDRVDMLAKMTPEAVEELSSKLFNYSPTQVRIDVR